jgi:hypothetical protein
MEVHHCAQMCPFGGALPVSCLTGRILVYGSIQMITGYWLLLPGFTSSLFNATGYHYGSPYIRIFWLRWGDCVCGNCVYGNCVYGNCVCVVTSAAAYPFVLSV